MNDGNTGASRIIRAAIIPPEWTTIQDAAKQTGVSESVISRAIRSGEIEHIRIESAHAIGYRRLMRIEDVRTIDKQPYYQSGETRYEAPDGLPAFLRRLRMGRGWSQQEMCRRIGLTKTAMYSYERGKALPSGDTLIRMVETLKLTRDEEDELYSLVIAEEMDRRAQRWKQRRKRAA